MKGLLFSITTIGCFLFYILSGNKFPKNKVPVNTEFIRVLSSWRGYLCEGGGTSPCRIKLPEDGVSSKQLSPLLASSDSEGVLTLKIHLDSLRATDRNNFINNYSSELTMPYSLIIDDGVLNALDLNEGLNTIPSGTYETVLLTENVYQIVIPLIAE